MSRPNDARSVTSKVLAILDAFTPAEPELTLAQIAWRADLSKPTAHRRVAELVEWGALERDAGGTFRIGVRLWEIASLAPRVLPLRELALPCLEDLMRLTNGNSQLAVRKGDEALFIERLRGRNALVAHTSAANRLPLTAPAVGRALLAHAPQTVQGEVLAGPIPRYTEYTVCDPREMRAVLEAVRSNGYAVSDRQVDLRATSVASPIFDSTGSVTAAIGVVFEHGKIEVDRLSNVVVMFARALTHLYSTNFGGEDPHDDESAA